MKGFAIVQPKEIILSISLHRFYDSSSQVYCGTNYIRVETTLSIRVIFLCAPLKRLSIRGLDKFVSRRLTFRARK